MKCMHTLAALAFLAAFVPHVPLQAQGLDSSKAIETIIGSDVETEEESAAADRDTLVAAIENTSDSIMQVHKSFNLDKVEIVFLPDFGESGDKVKSALDEHKPQIKELREAIEGNAMFFHAVTSRSVSLDRIIAVRFNGDNGVRIYAIGDPPAQ